MLHPTVPISPPARTPWYTHLYVQVLVAIVARRRCSAISAPATGEALKPLGDGFIKLVKMIIAPVIFLTLVTGIAGMRDLAAVGRVAGKAFAYFLFFSTLALIVGLIVANVVQPGAGMNIDPATLDAGAVADYAAKAHETTLTGFLLGDHPRHVRLGADRGQHPAGAVRRDPVRHRAGAGRRARRAGARPARACRPVVFRLVGDPDEGGADRRVRRDGLHHRQIRRRQRSPTSARWSRTFYLTVAAVRARRARRGRAAARLLDLQADRAISRPSCCWCSAPRRRRAALPSLIEKMERAGCAKSVVGLVVPTGYSLQPRRHQHLHDAGGAVHRAGDATST